MTHELVAAADVPGEFRSIVIVVDVNSVVQIFVVLIIMLWLGSGFCGRPEFQRGTAAIGRTGCVTHKLECGLQEHVRGVSIDPSLNIYL